MKTLMLGVAGISIGAAAGKLLGAVTQAMSIEALAASSTVLILFGWLGERVLSRRTRAD